LRAAGLPSFNENNWLSTIRHEIKVHEKYENMPDRSPDLPVGSKAEPADILYEDTTGKFLDFLEHEDSVGIEPWLRALPMIKRKYYIEVKTTTRDCDAVFHMSKGQHTRVSTNIPFHFVFVADEASDAQDAQYEWVPTRRCLRRMPSLQSALERHQHALLCQPWERAGSTHSGLGDFSPTHEFRWIRFCGTKPDTELYEQGLRSQACQIGPMADTIDQPQVLSKSSGEAAKPTMF